MLLNFCKLAKSQGKVAAGYRKALGENISLSGRR